MGASASRPAAAPPAAPPGMRLDKYVVGRVLARTGNSIVFAGHDSALQTPVALKVVSAPASDVGRRLLQNEIRVMRRVKHPHILPLLDVIEVSGRTVIVTPLAHCTLGDLIQSDRRHSEEWVRFVIRQLLHALDHLHSQFMIHRDVKPANIYVLNDDSDRPNIVLADFGCAADLTDNFDNELLGTSAFIAPEVYAGRSCMFIFP
jgi:serine/threonine protein kinase